MLCTTYIVHRDGRIEDSLICLDNVAYCLIFFLANSNVFRCRAANEKKLSLAITSSSH